jgi:hypothetical protein
MPTLSESIDAIDVLPRYAVDYGGTLVQHVLSITRDSSYEQFAQSCRILVAAYPGAVSPNLITEIKVYEGYGSELVIVFTGYVDEIVTSSFPDTWEIVCTDALKRATATWLDKTGITFNSAQAEDAVEDLLALAGLAVTADTTDFTIGDAHPSAFKLMSVQDAMQQIAALIGWRIWCGADGTIYFKYMRPRPSDTATWTYAYGLNILKYSYTLTDRNLRNRIQVIGYDTIESTAFADSPYVPDPPKYRTAILSSEIVDTQGMADYISGRMLTELNTRTRSIEMDVPGNPYLQVGKSIHVDEPTRSLDHQFFIYAVRTIYEAGNYVFTLTVVADEDGTTVPNFEEPPPTPNPTPTPPPPVDPGGPQQGDWRSKVYLAMDGAGVFYSEDFTGPAGAMPTWTAVNTGLVSLNVTGLLGDPFRPSYRQYAKTGGIVDTAAVLYRRENSGSWVNILDEETAAIACGFSFATRQAYIQDFDVDVNWDGRIIVAIALHNGGDYQRERFVLESHDYGASWIPLEVNASLHSFLNPTFGVLRHGAFSGPNLIYATMYSMGAFSGGGLLKSTNEGSTFAYPAAGLGASEWEGLLAVDPNSPVVYLWRLNSGLFRSLDYGETFTKIDDNFEAQITTQSRYELSTVYVPEGGPSQVLRMFTGDAQLRKSLDGGASWTTQAVSRQFLGISMLQDAQDKLYLVGGLGSHIYVSEDEGATITDKGGTDQTDSTTTGIPGNAGNCSGILQVWDV